MKARERCKAERCNQHITMNGMCRVHWVEETLDARAKAKLERSESDD